MISKLDDFVHNSILRYPEKTNQEIADMFIKNWTSYDGGKGIVLPYFKKKYGADSEATSQLRDALSVWVQERLGDETERIESVKK